MAEERKAEDTWYDGKPQALTGVVRKLERNLGTARFLDGAITRLFFGEGILPAGTTAQADGGLGKASSFLRAIDGLTQENLIKSVLEAAASMIVRKPAIKIVTTGSSWKKQVASRRASRLVTGVFATSGFEAATTPVFLDSCRCQIAAVKWSVDAIGKVTAERALPHTIIYNPAQGPTPRDLFQRHGVSRSGLAKRFPDHAATIGKLPNYRPDPAFHGDSWTWVSDADEVEVTEGWRLPRGEDEGRYVMCAGDLVLVDEVWDLPLFPLVVLTFGDSYATMAGDPLGRQVLPFQLRLNRMNRTIDEVAVKCGPPKIAIPKGSEVEGVTNAVAEQFYYNAAAGEVHWIPGQMLPPQYYAEKEGLKRDAHALAGVSQSVAGATHSPGVNSGRAQREEFDRASGRLVLHAEKLERWFEANARCALALMRKAYGTKSQRIKAPNTKILEEIDWREIGDLREDEIEVRAYITSSIPNTPAGRAETLAERVEAGVMTQRRASRWFADPDTARLEDQDSAAEDLALRMIDTALIDGEVVQPDPILGQEGLELLVDSGSRELMRAMTLPEPPPETNRELLRRLIAEAKLLMKAPANDAAPPAPAVAPAQALLGAQPAAA